MKVASFYRFLDIDDPASFRNELQLLCNERALLGTVLVAAEGFNGTLAGSKASIIDVLGWLRQRFAIGTELDVRWTETTDAPFRRMRVRVKKEIVALGRPDILPQQRTGKYVPPEKWNALIDDPDVLLIDTRNHYEHEIGTFPGAVDPGNDSFREFPRFAQTLSKTNCDRPVAMFCTGGIRCEKFAPYLKEKGFREVFQLGGGILAYLEEIPENESLWEGECFVFDERVTVDEELKKGRAEDLSKEKNKK